MTAYRRDEVEPGPSSARWAGYEHMQRHASPGGAAVAGAITGAVIGLAVGPFTAVPVALIGSAVGLLAERLLHSGSGEGGHAPEPWKGDFAPDDIRARARERVLQLDRGRSEHARVELGAAEALPRLVSRGAGELEVRKAVQVEHRTLEVPIAREELIVERLRLGHRPPGSPVGERREVRLAIHEEKVQLEKREVVREVVSRARQREREVERAATPRSGDSPPA